MFVAITCVFVSTLLHRVDADGLGFETKWNYNASSNIGPSHWSTNYPKCNGSSQSPIDIKTKDASYDKTLQPLELKNYETAGNLKYAMRNTGSTVRVDVTSNDATMDEIPELKFDGSTYRLLQFHFHWGDVNTQGSEHTFNGKAYAVEVHLVHYNKKYNAGEAAQYPDGLLVWAQYIKVVGTAANSKLARITSYLNKIKFEHSEYNLVAFPISFLLPLDSTGTYYIYAGSLTTPGCNEAVTWVVNHKSIEINQDQMNEFHLLSKNINGTEEEPVSNNFRPVQNINGRVVKKSFPGDNPISRAANHISSVVVITFLMTFIQAIV